MEHRKCNLALHTQYETTNGLFSRQLESIFYLHKLLQYSNNYTLNKMRFFNKLYTNNEKLTN